MTRIDFYHYAEDKLTVACRLAAKAYSAASRVVIYSPDPAVLAEVDRRLWSHPPTRFLPHCMEGAAVAAETPIILAATGDALPHHDVLVNLADTEPAFFPTFERLLEIVAHDEDDKAKARKRYSFYKKRGYEITVQSIAG